MRKQRIIPPDSLTKDRKAFYRDEVVEIGEAGFAVVCVDNGNVSGKKVLLVVCDDFMFRRPTIFSDKGEPLRVTKDFTVDRYGIFYQLKGDKWVAINARNPRKFAGGIGEKSHQPNVR